VPHTCWDVKKREFVAGLVLALATVKFQIVLILALLLVVSRKFRLIGGFFAGCAFLALASVLVTGGSGIIEYSRFVHRFDLHNGYGNVNPASMMNWRGVLAGIGWEDHLRLYSTIGSAILIALGIVASQWVRATKNQELGFSLYFAIALAASPYNFFSGCSHPALVNFPGHESGCKKTIDRSPVEACGFMLRTDVCVACHFADLRQPLFLEQPYFI
jgi:hypothetical protein